MMKLHIPHWRVAVASVLLAVTGATPTSAGARHLRAHSKLSVKAREDAKARGGKGKIDVFVRFRRNPGAAERSLVTASGGKIRRQNRSRWMSLRIPANAVAALAD